MSVEFARLIAIYGADTSGFDSSAAKVNATLQKQSGVLDVAFGSYFGNIMARASGAVLGLGETALKSYTDYEQLGLSVQSLTARELLNAGAAHSMSEALKQAGPAAKETLMWIQKLAIQSPFTMDGVAMAYRQAQAYGFTGQEARKLTQDLIDFAAGTGGSEASMNSIALALGQVKAKGHLAGQEILQLVNTGLPVLQILAKAFGKSTGEIQKMVEGGLIPADAAIQAISQSIEHDFGGAAARQTHTMAGLMSSMHDVMEIDLREYFTGTFEAIQPYLDRFTTAMQDPKTIEMIRGWGKELGTDVGQIAGGLEGLLTTWNSMGDGAHNAVMGMGEMAIVAPILANVATWGLGATTAIMGMTSAAYAAWGAWQAGLTLTSALEVGFGATAISVAAVTAALVALVAVWYVWNKEITQTQQAGLASSVDSWTAAFDKVKARGGDANEVLKTYRDGIDGLNRGYEAGGVIAQVFVDKQQILTSGFKQAEAALRTQAGSYEDYMTSTKRAAEAAGLMIDGEGNLVRRYREGQFARTQMVQANVLMTRSMFEATNGGDLLDNQLGKVDKDAHNAATGLIDLKQAAVASNDIMSGLKSTLKDLGYSEDEIKKLSEDMAVGLGDTTQGARQATDDVNMLTSAYANHIITQQDYITFMAAAKDGTLALTDAQRSQISAQVEAANTAREAEQTARDSATAYWGLAESLKGASNAELARQAISDLTKMMNDSKGDPEDYAAAIQNIGKQYGLMDDKSLALAANLPKFEQLLKDGVIPAKDAAAALAGLNQEAADGTVDWEAYLKKFGATPAAAADVAKATGTDTAGAIKAATPEVQAGMDEWTKAAQDTAKKIGTTFTNEDWVGIGKNIDAGIAKGITDNAGLIITAAENAAAAAIAATEAANGIQSPSTEYRDRVGRMIPRGWAEGIRADSNYPIDAVRDVAHAALGAASEAGAPVTANGAPYYMGEEGGMRVEFNGPVSIMVENKQTLEGVLKEMKVR